MLNNKIRAMNNSALALVAKWLFSLPHSDEIIMIICMNTGLIMKNGVVDLFPFLQQSFHSSTTPQFVLQAEKKKRGFILCSSLLVLSVKFDKEDV